MKIKKIIYDLIKKNEKFRKLARRIKTICLKINYFCSSPNAFVNENIIYFNTFDGKSYSDSPKAIYEKMLSDGRFSNKKFVWGFREPEKYKHLEENSNTSIVRVGTKEESQILREAKYWITNYKMQDYKRPGANQIYVQCWHGTPLKRLGYDIENNENAMNSIDEIRDKYKTDALRFKYLLSPSKFATEKFVSAWNLKAFNKENCIIEEGYPRNDRLINTVETEIDSLKIKLGINSKKKVILYAPTWRDNQHLSGVGYTYDTEVDFDYLNQILNEEFIILFRAHYLVANKFNFEKYKNFIINVSEWDDINDLYLVSDILVTDYSSVFFDYANLKRPIIFYMYDLEHYRDNLRGLYISLDELPGPIVKNERNLAEAIKNYKNWHINDKYVQFNKKYNYLDDGKVTERVIERIFS